MYDYLIVGAGLFGSVFAHEAARAGGQSHELVGRPGSKRRKEGSCNR